MITRETYLKKLRLLKGKDVIKVITGVRRCGKSSLLQAFQKELLNSGVSPKNIFFYNFEERENIQFAEWTALYDEIIAKVNPNQTNYVFLDEVQMINNFEKLVSGLFVKKNIDLYVTGSNAYLLSSELATLLTGRYIAINLHPYSFAEYVLAFPEEKNTDRLFRQFMNNSTFPEAVTISKTAPNLVNDYVQSIYDTVVMRDIVQRRKLRNIHNLQRIIEFLFDSVGSLVSPTNIAEQLNKNSDKNISHNTVNKLIGYLTEAYILYAVPRYDIKGKELLTTNEKYYLVDLGLKNITSSNRYDADLGHKLENVVYLELLRRGGKVFVGKTNNEKEVDFLVQKANNEREYYQVAFTVNDEKTSEREFSSLRNIKDSYPKYILTMDYDDAIVDGIQKINVIDWLLNTPTDTINTIADDTINDTVNDTINDTINLSDIENKILKLISKKSGIHAPAISKKTGKSLATTKRYLAKLKNIDRIEFRGALKTGGYYLKPRSSGHSEAAADVDL